MSAAGMAAISQLPRLHALRLQLGPPSAQVPRQPSQRTHGVGTLHLLSSALRKWWPQKLWRCLSGICHQPSLTLLNITATTACKCSENVWHTLDERHRKYSYSYCTRTRIVRL